MQPEELISLQNSLRKELADNGLSAILVELKKKLPERTEKYNLVFQLEIRLNRVNKDRIKGLLSQEQLELAYNQLSDDILNLLDQLTTADFDPAAASNVKESHKTGSVLYQIPHIMELDSDKEYRCIVRLAFSDEVIVENVDLSKDTVLKPIRVSEVMEVELKDPNDAPAFNIRQVNSAEQFLEDQAYTEWQFYVRPIRSGVLPLLLLIAVKEYIKDRPVKREIVLEEIIKVVAEPSEAIEEAPAFQHSGYNFVYTSAPDNQRETFVSTIFQGKYSMVASVLLIIMFAAGIWAIGTSLGWFKRQPKFIEVPAENKKNRPKSEQNGHKDTSKSTTNIILDTVSTTTRLPLDTVKPSNKLPNPTITKQKAIAKLKNTRKKTIQSEAKDSKIEPVPITQTDPSKIRKSGFTMVKVEGGTLAIGQHYETKDCPLKEENLNTFYIGKYEITQADWMEIMGKNPAFKKNCPECPVENVSWISVQDFVQQASKARHKKYRLPFEIEWEYAALGGRNPQNFLYAGSSRPGEVAWFNTINDFTHKVGLKNPNTLDIYDMSGNVREWCQGIFPAYLNCSAEQVEKKPLRGGTWANQKGKIKIVDRVSKNIKFKDKQSGLRLVEDK